MSWMQTYTGIPFYILNPKEEDVSLTDIVHSLVFKCRFNGHCKHFYSVAQHSLMMYKYAPKRIKLQVLVHDASEVYTADLISPYKDILGDKAKMIECAIQDVINQKLGITDYTARDLVEIKRLDKKALAAEYRDLMVKDLDWTILKGVIPFKDECKEESFNVVKGKFWEALGVLGFNREDYEQLV